MSVKAAEDLARDVEENDRMSIGLLRARIVCELDDVRISTSNTRG
jgi:hypothetical protein